MLSKLKKIFLGWDVKVSDKNIKAVIIMARGGRSRGHRSHIGSHRRGFHSSHPHYGRQPVNNAAVFQIMMDAVSTASRSVLLQDTLYLSGSTQAVMAQLERFESIQPTQYVDPMTMGMAMDPNMTGGMMMNNYAMQPQGMSPNPMNTGEPLLESYPGQMVGMEQMCVSPNMMNPFGAPQQMMMVPPPVPVATQNHFPKVDITVIGNKTSAYNACCYCFTMFFASLLIFPLCFMCCMWWKKIVYPKYEVNIEFYRAVGRFLRSTNTVTHLTLNICDNAFDAAKARALYESLEGTSLQQFTLSNKALACNYQSDEADSFLQNVTPIKGLNMTANMTWGDQTL